MCYVKSAKDVKSREDLQVLISDTVYAQRKPFTFDDVKSCVMETIEHGHGLSFLNMDTEVIVSQLLFSTLEALMRRRIVVPYTGSYLQYIE